MNDPEKIGVLQSSHGVFSGLTARMGIVMTPNISALLITIMGVLLGISVYYIGNLESKWIFPVILLCIAPSLAVVFKSLKKVLVAILIVSLSMNIKITPGFSNVYSEMRPGIPITLIGAILFVLYFLWLIKLKDGFPSIRYYPWVTFPFLLILIMAGLTFFIAPKPSWVLYKFPRAIEAFLIYFFIGNYARSKENISFIGKCMAITIAISSLWGLCQFFAGTTFNLGFLGEKDALNYLGYGSKSLSRVSGFLGHANNLAFFLAGWLPIVLVFALAGIRPQFLYIVSFALGLLTMVLTYSRGSWLAFSISALLISFLLIRSNGRQIIQKIIPRLVTFALAAVILIMPFSEKVFTRLTIDDYGAAYARLSLAQTSLNIIKDHPLLGVGLGNYPIVVGNYDRNIKSSDSFTDDNEMEQAQFYVHNMYLYTASEIGIPGLILVLWLFIGFLRQGFLNINSPDGLTRIFSIGLVGGLTCSLLHGMVELGTLGDPKFVSLAFVGGLIMALSNPIFEADSKV